MPQATIGGIEAGLVSPRVDTLVRLLAATGHELSVDRHLGERMDRSVIRDRLGMTPLERVRPTKGRFDPIPVLRRLRRYGVRFVLIGGLAARAHGTPKSAVDLDVCHSRDPENLERLSSALRDLGATPRLDRPMLEQEDSFAFTTKHGGLDVVGTPAGVTGFQDLNANAVELRVGVGLIVRVASLDDLIRMMRASGRPKDTVELELLGALRDEIDEAAKAKRFGTP
jgi:hypothetical protein